MARDVMLDTGYFESVYADSNDPWGFQTRWYERRKYDLTLAALPKPRYRRAFEPGCSIGVFSEGLAARCDELISCDLVPRIANAARERLARFPGARVETGGIPGYWPTGSFDLVVFSEVGYYLGAPGLAKALDRAVARLEPGGHLVSVHYTGSTDYPLTGDVVQSTVADLPGFEGVCALEDREFSLLVMQRAD